MPLPFHILFFSTLTLSTAITLSASHWLYIWIGMEINMLSFIPLLSSNQTTQSAEGAVKYFIIQASGSALFLMAMNTAYSLLTPPPITSIIIAFSLLLKMGAAPLHFWLPPVASAMSWPPLILLLTWQKLIPIVIFTSTLSWPSKLFPLTLGALSAITGGLAIIGQSKLRSIMAYSSITHMGWMLSISAINPPLTLTYLLIYSLLSIPLMSIFASASISSLMESKKTLATPHLITLALLLLSLGGLPPLSGFSLKWLALSTLSANISLVFIFPLLIGSLLNLSAYLNLLFFSFNLKYMSPPHQTTRISPTLSAMAIASLPLTDILLTA